MWGGDAVSQNPTVCAGGYLTGTEVMNDMSTAPGQREGGNFNLFSTTPPGGTLNIIPAASNEDFIFSGFDASYSSYTIYYDRGPGYYVTYDVSGSAPTVTLSSPSPSNVCTGDNVVVEITLSGTGGNWNVQLDGTPSGSQTYSLSSSNSGDTHFFTYALNSDATFEISSVVDLSGSGCEVTTSNLPDPLSFTVEPDPTPQLTSGTGVCSSDNLDIILDNSESGIEYYVVYDDGTTASEVSDTRWTGDGGSHLFPSINEGTGEYYIAADGCNGEVMMNGGPFYISSSPSSNPSISSTSPACPGSDLNVDYTEGSDVRYYLLRNGSPTGAYKDGNNGTITFGGLSTPGTYTIEADRNGCSVLIGGSFVIQASPSVFNLSANKTSYCAGASPTGVQLSLDGSESGIEYQLQHDDGSGYTNVASPINGDGNLLSPASWSDLTEGSYRVIATSTAGCTTTMSGIPVIVESNPPTATITTSTPNSRCEGTSVDFYINVSLTGTQPFSFEITNNIGDAPITVNNNNNDTYSFQVNPSSNVTYTLTNLVDGSGCNPVTNVGQVQFYVRPNPVFTFEASPNPVTTSGGTSSTSVCAGSQVTLGANVSNTSGPYDYFWSNSLGTTQFVSFYPNTTRTYYATVENEYGCTTTRQIDVVVNSLPIVDFEPENGDYEVCANGGSVELIPVAPNTAGDFTGTGVSGNFFNPSVAGVGRHPITYSFTNTTTGCENSITKDIDVNPVPNVNAQGNQTDYCDGAGVVDIYGYPQNSNGIWTIVGGSRPWFGDGGDGTAQLDVDQALNLTGGGSFNLVYQYTDPTTGCIGQDILTVNIHPNLADELEFEYRSTTAAPTDPWLPFPAGDLPMCQTGDVINLRGIFDGTGTTVGDGIFTGPGVTDTGAGTAEFDPSVAGNGNHTITYTYTDPVTTCTGTITHTIQIGTTLEFPGLNSLYCAADGPVNVYGDEVPSSGISGTLEIFDNTNPAIPVPIYTQSGNSAAIPFSFDPSTEGAGDYLFRFTYNDG
ncbi:MAG: hypothetical protein JG782_1519, partial [Anaerophaga sp.]|nr:hypothetical protein [Anaerophaga sp.]